MAKSVDAADLKSASPGSAGSSPAVRTIAALLLSLASAACERPERGPLAVSVIGGAPALADPNQRPLAPPDKALLTATARGLLAFDAAGTVEPGLARRWIVTDDGLSVLFRIDEDARWHDGRPITAHQIARRLRATLGRNSLNPLKGLLGVVTRVQSTTDEVLELRLAAPRANLLTLFAQPELAMLRDGHGSGPFRVAERTGDRMTLERELTADEGEEPRREHVHLRGERAALALARFRRGLADLVLGGTLADLPLARAADLSEPALRFDPAAGLFGLIAANGGGVLADAAVRDALSMALDRDVIVAALDVPGLAPRVTVLPSGTGPVVGTPGWAALPLADRRRDAARILAAVGEGSAPVPLRVAMPDSPGHRLLFALLDRDWRAVGVAATRVSRGAPADLLLVDEVAPSPALAWYLDPFSCPAAPICVPEIDAALAASRVETDPALRRAQQADAANRIAAEALFIPLAAPIRWSAVAPGVAGFRPNPLARHGLATLREAEAR